MAYHFIIIIDDIMPRIAKWIMDILIHHHLKRPI